MGTDIDCSNSMKVLGLVGLAESIRAQTSPLDALIESNANGDLLASSPLPASWEASHSQPATGVRRTNINLMLRDNVISHGVEVRYGYELEDFQEDDCCIRAMFTNGETVVGDFLIGCDGIKSKTRTVLVKRHGVQEGQPVFTGLSQVRQHSWTGIPMITLDRPQAYHQHHRSSRVFLQCGTGMVPACMSLHTRCQLRILPGQSLFPKRTKHKNLGDCVRTMKSRLNVRNFDSQLPASNLGFKICCLPANESSNLASSTGQSYRPNIGTLRDVCSWETRHILQVHILDKELIKRCESHFACSSE